MNPDIVSVAKSIDNIVRIGKSATCRILNKIKERLREKRTQFETVDKMIITLENYVTSVSF